MKSFRARVAVLVSLVCILVAISVPVFTQSPNAPALGARTKATLYNNSGWVTVGNDGSISQSAASGKSIGFYSPIQYAGIDTLQVAQVTIGTAAVLTLNSTPVTLIAAPGAGKIVVVDSVSAKLVFNSAAYTGANNIEIRATNGSGVKVAADITSTFLDSSSGTNYYQSGGVSTGYVPVANAAIVASVPTANPAAGNSNVVLTLRYHTITP